MPRKLSCRLGIKKLFGENNPMWKGDKAGRSAIHEHIRNRLIKPKFCEFCKIKSPIDLANISQEYKRELNDWEWLCRSCHMKKDGRIKNLSTRLPYEKYKRGENHPNSKITSKIVLEIRSYRKIGYSYKEIANIFNISESYVGPIVKRKVWNHI